jgi:hypothetical protein
MSAPTPTFKAPIRERFERVLFVRLYSVAEGGREIGAGSQTINVSEHGLLVEVPRTLDACVGQEVMVVLSWGNSSFRSHGEIVRFESPYWREPAKQVMGVRLQDALPPELLKGR